MAQKKYSRYHVFVFRGDPMTGKSILANTIKDPDTAVIDDFCLTESKPLYYFCSRLFEPAYNKDGSTRYYHKVIIITDNERSEQGVIDMLIYLYPEIKISKVYFEKVEVEDTDGKES